jgi:hypothetical protein
MDNTEILEKVAATLRRLLNEIEEVKPHGDVVWFLVMADELRQAADLLDLPN